MASTPPLELELEWLTGTRDEVDGYHRCSHVRLAKQCIPELVSKYCAINKTHDDSVGWVKVVSGAASLRGMLNAFVNHCCNFSGTTVLQTVFLIEAAFMAVDRTR